MAEMKSYDFLPLSMTEPSIKKALWASGGLSKIRTKTFKTHRGHRPRERGSPGRKLSANDSGGVSKGP